MAKYNFYNGYSIDDSDIGCDKVIVSQCPTSGSDMPNHVYKSICELIADCPAIRQLTNDCIVDFLNKDRSGTYDGNNPKFLKLKSNGCFEWGTLECPCSDELVKASSCDDEAGYLNEKLEGGESSNGLYSIDVNLDSCNRLRIEPEGPSNTYIKAGDVPSEGSGNIRYKNGNIYYEEDLDTDTTSNISYARRYHNGGSCLVPTNDWGTVWGANQGNISSNDQRIFMGTTKLVGTKDIIKGSGHHIFGLTRPGVYQINLNSSVRIGSDNNTSSESWVFAIRAGIITDGGGTYTQRYAGKTCGDVKYQARVYSDRINDFYPAGNSQSEVGPLTARHLELGIMSFCSSYMLHVESASADSPVWICYRVRYDTRVGGDPRNVNGQPETVELRLCSDGDDEPGTMTTGTDKEGTNTVITCARIGEYPRLRVL